MPTATELFLCKVAGLYLQLYLQKTPSQVSLFKVLQSGIKKILETNVCQKLWLLNLWIAIRQSWKYKGFL